MSDHDQLVRRIADAIEPLIIGETTYLPDLLQAVYRELWARQDARKAADLAAERAEFKQEHGLLTWTEFSAKYGLHASERWAAERILPQKSSIERLKYYLDKEPTDEQRQAIAHETTMSARQAAEYLGISRQQFDKLKKQHRLEPARNIRTGYTASGFTKAAYLYRKSDIDKLKA